MTSRWQEEPYDITALLYGGGYEAQLVLHIPNSKDIKDIKECSYYNRFKAFQHQRIDDFLFSDLQRLQSEIQEYCEYSSFFTYESAPALELCVYDYRDRVR